VLAEQQVALAVHGEAVGALVRRSFIGAAGLQEDGGSRVALDPLVRGVVRHVGEDDASFVPHGAFGPGEAGREGLDLRASVQERIQGGVELLDGLLGAFGGEGTDQGKQQGGDERGLHGVRRG
jgi:hypothetical protein